MRRRVAAVLPGLLGSLPEPVGRELCAWIGRGAHRLIERDRRLARNNLARVFGWEGGRVRREARMVFEEIGRNVYDFARYPCLSQEARDRLIAVEGGAHLDAAVAAGRGVVLVAPHMGSWELLAAQLARAGYPFLAMARPLREPALDDLLAAHRRRLGFATLPARGGLLRAARHLRRGGVLGVLADQRVRDASSVVVQFLGQPTRMTDGPARLALSTGAAVVPAAIARTDGNSHRILVLPALPGPVAGGGAIALTQQIASAMETLILEAPRQWMWIHPRWPAAERAS